MDIFAHGLWTGAAAKAANSNNSISRKIKKPLNIWRAIFWGVFPDLFAFTLPFVWLFGNVIFGNLSFSDFPKPENTEPFPRDTLPVFNLASRLYNFSHSLIVFFLIFTIVWIILRRPIWEMLGWFLHILIDIPTHSYRFFPTPFLWPVSQWKINGFSWATPWFLILNYAAIILAYWFLKKRTARLKTQNQNAAKI